MTDVHLSNYVTTLWDVVAAESTREVKEYSGIDAPWPAIRVDFSIRRLSWLDQKLAVLPLICENPYSYPKAQTCTTIRSKVPRKKFRSVSYTHLTLPTILLV